MQKITNSVIFVVVFSASAFLASANDDKEVIGAKILKGVRQRDWSTFDTKDSTNADAGILSRASEIVVASAGLCTPGSLCADEQSNLPNKESDSRPTSNLKPTVAHETQAKPSKDKPVNKDKGSTSGSVPIIQAPVPITKVLVLKSQDKTDARLILEWERGQYLNWSFICATAYNKSIVRAHTSVVLRHSPFLLKFRAKPNSAVLNYPPNIVESIVTLMYKHKVTINDADYAKITELAKLLEMNNIVENAQTKQSIEKCQASTSGSKPQPSVPTQVLVLNSQDKTDARLISEWKRGQNLNWSFNCVAGSNRSIVRAHTSVVLRHSPFLYKYRAKPNSAILRDPAKIVEYIVTLMYEHKVTINKADYVEIMRLAKLLEMDTMMSVLEDDVVRPSYRG